MNYKKICVNEAIALIIISLVNQVILGAAKEIIIDTASAGWLHAILVSIIAITFVFIVCKLFSKFQNFDIIDISKFLGGNVLKFIVCLLLITFFVFSAVLIINHICNCLTMIYLPNISFLFLVLLVMLGSIIVAKKGIHVIAKTNLIILYILAIPMLVLFLHSIFKLEFDNLFPILGYGIKETFLSNFTNVYSFSGLIYLFLIMPLIQDTSKFTKVGLVAVIISSLYLFLAVVSLLLTFPFSSITEDLLSIYLLARIVSFGSFLERVDVIYVFLWILSSFSYISLIFYFITHSFQKMANIKNKNGMLYCFATIVLGFVVFIKNVTILRICQRYIFPYSAIALFIFLFIILLIAYFKNKRKPINSK